MMMMEISHFQGMVATAAVFILVQILVYLILSKSSQVFSKKMNRSLSFRQVQSLSRIIKPLSDFPSSSDSSETTFDEGSS
ncbi:uncharacterized protein LOC120086089 [Benincasa hispida]|uniref:uncharacterized protein LOC120086089 n=1 Tax=Benincasa hispida TaxID=102211 RepID=UPI0018FFAE79|nr:uncharacterized protein LOC120086089 [Benincasa hispida]